MQNIPGYPQYKINPNQAPANFSAANDPNNAPKVIQNNPIMSHAASSTENPTWMLAGTLGSAAGLIGLNNLINKPLLTKDYNDTIFKTIEKAVDKFASKPKIKVVADAANNLKTKATNVINNSEILRTLFRKPGIGGQMVQSQAAGARGHLATRAIEVMRKYKEANPNSTVFDAIIKKADKDAYKYYDEIINTIKRSGINPNQVMTKKPWWGLGLIKNESSFKEILNKDTLINNYKASGKTLGQKASGLTLRGSECVTNGIFGGKGQILMQAFFLAQSMKEASKAEKGEKFSTFMASWSELMAFMATSGVQMRIVNHIGGLKNMGMSVADVAKYQKAMRIANSAAKAGNHKAYLKMTMVMDQIKNAAKANIKWYQKPLKWIGEIMSFGRINETLKPLKMNKIANAWAKVPYGLKVGLGYIGRVAFVMGVVIPIFSGIAKKISYAIFGKPVKTLEREKREAEATEQNAAGQTATIPNAPNPSTQQVQQPAEQPQVVQQTPYGPNPPFTQQPQMPIQPARPGNLLEKMQNQYAQQQSMPIGAQGLTQQPQQPIAAAPINQSPDAGIKRTYIPNPVLGVENVQSMSETRTAKIDEALRQADIAEMNAQKFL